jgi:glutamate racemase
VQLLSQGKIVAESLADYLKRHPEMEERLTKGGAKQFFTTDSVADFDRHARLFYGADVQAKHVELLK